MIARIAWLASVIALAAIVALAQLDRTARFEPAYAPFVPHAFSGFAAEQRTRLALGAGDTPRAMAEARALVRARPLPAEHLAQLSVATAFAGDQAAAAAALEAASLRGWREPLSQYASARAALASGEHAIAAQRIAALFATGTQREAATALFARLISEHNGRQAMAQIYVQGGHWQGASIALLADRVEPRDFAAMLGLALDAGADLPCAPVAALSTNYRNRGLDAETEGLRTARCT